jgi:predicted RNase H-like HicB family nuclease
MKPRGHRSMEKLKIEIDREDDGRFIAEVPDLAGVIVYGATLEDAVAKAQALALRVIADRIEHGESVPGVASVFTVQYHA